MKIALDENVPSAAVKMLAGLAKETDSKITVVSARKYRPVDEHGDENWVRRFARAKGTVVVTGDARIRSDLHEQAAFYQAGMIVFFFDGQWNGYQLHNKAAMLLTWWPEIIKKAKESKRGDFWEMPSNWTIKQMRLVTPPAHAIAKHRDAKSVGKIPRSRSRRRVQRTTGGV